MATLPNGSRTIFGDLSRLFRQLSEADGMFSLLSRKNQRSANEDAEMMSLRIAQHECRASIEALEEYSLRNGLV